MQTQTLKTGHTAGRGWLYRLVRARHYVPLVGWIIAYVEWMKACRTCDRAGAIPFSREWENTFKAYDKTVMAFGITVVFLMACAMICALWP